MIFEAKMEQEARKPWEGRQMPRYTKVLMIISAREEDAAIQQETGVDAVTLTVYHKIANGTLSKGHVPQPGEIEFLMDPHRGAAGRKMYTGPLKRPTMEQRIRRIEKNFARVGEARLKELGVPELPPLERWDAYQKLLALDLQRKERKKKRSAT